MENFKQKNMSSFENQVKNFLDERKFDAAAKAFREQETEILPIHLLLQKSTVIQLADDAAGYTLDDARNALIQALTQDPTYAEGWIELGHFYYAIDDEAKQALNCFDRAFELASSLHLQALLGRAKVLADLDRTDDAIELLNRTHPAEWSREISTLLLELSNE